MPPCCHAGGWPSVAVPPRCAGAAALFGRLLAPVLLHADAVVQPPLGPAHTVVQWRLWTAFCRRRSAVAAGFRSVRRRPKFLAGALRQRVRRLPRPAGAGPAPARLRSAAPARAASAAVWRGLRRRSWRWLWGRLRGRRRGCRRTPVCAPSPSGLVQQPRLRAAAARLPRRPALVRRMGRTAVVDPVQQPGPVRLQRVVPQPPGRSRRPAVAAGGRAAVPRERGRAGQAGRAGPLVGGEGRAAQGPHLPAARYSARHRRRARARAHAERGRQRQRPRWHGWQGPGVARAAGRRGWPRLPRLEPPLVRGHSRKRRAP